MRFRILSTAIMAAVIFLSDEVSAEIRMTAGYLKKSADTVALTFATDAKLALVSCYEIDSTGKSSVWSYVYSSADSLKEYHFLAQNNRVTFDHSQEMRVGIGILSEPWIDSDSALSIAEREGGSDIRRLFPFSVISASLVRPIAPPFYCLWEIEYKLSGVVRTILIDASTAEVVTSVPTTDNRGLPIHYCLHQNYPNPFNPCTIIQYELPQRAHMSLSIFNALGQQVAELVNREQEAGNHKISFNGSGLSSGIYFYRMSVSPAATWDLVPTKVWDGQTGVFTKTKKFVLVK
jgi:hypothetical protein